jgi:hypothetical protein
VLEYYNYVVLVLDEKGPRGNIICRALTVEGDLFSTDIWIDRKGFFIAHTGSIASYQSDPDFRMFWTTVYDVSPEDPKLLDVKFGGKRNHLSKEMFTKMCKIRSESGACCYITEAIETEVRWMSRSTHADVKKVGLALKQK